MTLYYTEKIYLASVLAIQCWILFAKKIVGDSVRGEGLDPTINADCEKGEHQVLRKLLLPSKHGDPILTRCDATLEVEDNCCDL